MYGYRTNEDGTETLAWSVTDAGRVICIHNEQRVCGHCLEADERAVRALAAV